MCLINCVHTTQTEKFLSQVFQLPCTVRAIKRVSVVVMIHSDNALLKLMLIVYKGIACDRKLHFQNVKEPPHMCDSVTDGGSVTLTSCCIGYWLLLKSTKSTKVYGLFGTTATMRLFIFYTRISSIRPADVENQFSISLFLVNLLQLSLAFFCNFYNLIL